MKEEQIQWVAILAIGIVAVAAYMKATMGTSMLPPPPLPNGELPIKGAPLPIDSALPSEPEQSPHSANATE